ncbi:MAG: VCBS repeat-containing protein, partial [Lacipirellulaceae bacterium]
VNNDGRDDLYVCQSGGLPNRLFVAQPDGTARDIAREAGVDILDDSTCALFVDLDNDGNQDLALMTESGGFIFSGDGSGKFVPRTILAECRNAFSLTAADYDNDKLLDLYVGRYWPTRESRGDIAIPVPYYDAQNGGKNLLFRNRGSLEFEDVTKQTGLDEENTRYTMAAAWNDFNQDGRIDLYVANDFGRNCLYRNEGGKFTNVAAEAGVEDSASGMSVTLSDYDHDGLEDIYVSNMFSSAGSRTTYQRQYEERFGEEGVRKMQRMARGNTLFRNLGEGKYQDVSLPADVTMGRWAWGSLFADFNNDGWDDLAVLNGNITTEDTGDL